MSQKQYKPHYLDLKKKWLDRQKDVQKTIWEEHKESLEWLHKNTKHAIVVPLGAGVEMVVLGINDWLAIAISTAAKKIPEMARNTSGATPSWFREKRLAFSVKRLVCFCCFIGS